jgi:hypothetical protein
MFERASDARAVSEVKDNIKFFVTSFEESFYILNQSDSMFVDIKQITSGKIIHYGDIIMLD